MGHISTLRKRRAWTALQVVAYVILASVVLVGGALLIAGCASPTQYEDLRERAATAEKALEQQTEFTAGAHDDAAMLQRVIIEMELYIRQLEGGMAEQAEMTAKLREQCDI